MSLTFAIADAQAMEALGARLVGAWSQGGLITLQGELGTGKTTLVRGVLRGLGYSGTVKSPTYTLVEPYELATRRVYHFDLYRLAGAQELEVMGIRDYLDADALCLVEWPERTEGALPPPDLQLTLNYAGTGRTVRLQAGSATGQALLRAWA